MAFSTVFSGTVQGGMFVDRPVNATGSFPSRVPTLTEPVSAASQTATAQDVWDLRANGTMCSNMQVVPFGTGLATQTFSIRVIGWYQCVDATGASGVGLWVPNVLCEYLCTLGTTTGVATACVTDSELFCDTVGLVTNRGTDGQDTTKFSPTNNLIGRFMVDLKGCTKVELTYSLGTASGGNALVQFL